MPTASAPSAASLLARRAIPRRTGSAPRPPRRRCGGGDEGRFLYGEVCRAGQVEKRQKAPTLYRELPRKDQEEVEEQGRKERAVEIFGQEKRLPHRVARARRRHDIDRERGEAERPEDPRRPGALARDREEADQEIEQTDEREEEIGAIERYGRPRQTHLANRPAGHDEQDMRKGLARQAPLRLGQRSRRLAIRGDDAVSGREASRGGRAPRLDSSDHQRAA